VDLEHATIKNLNIKGTNTSPDVAGGLPYMGSYRQEVEFDHGVALHGAQGVELDNLDIRSVWGDGVKVTGVDQFSRRRSSDIVLRQVAVTQNGRQGMSINQSSNVLVDGATITYSRRGGIDLEPNGLSEVIDRIEVRNSFIASRLLPFPSGGNGPVNDVYIHDNRIGLAGIPLVYVRSTTGVARYNWRIERNFVQGPLGSPRSAFEFANVHGVHIEANVVNFALGRGMTAVTLSEGSSGAVLTCNMFSNAAIVASSEGADSPQLDRNTTAVGAAPCPPVATSVPATGPDSPGTRQPAPAGVASSTPAANVLTRPPGRSRVSAVRVRMAAIPGPGARQLTLRGAVLTRTADSERWTGAARARVRLEFRGLGARSSPSRLHAVSKASGRFRITVPDAPGVWRARYRYGPEKGSVAASKRVHVSQANSWLVAGGS
jgi:hypothetical protein